MGFFSGLTGMLGGGGKQSSTSSASGYNTMPEFAQQQLADLYGGIRMLASPYGNNQGGGIQANIDRYTPLAQTADETAAFDAIRKGFTPTAQSIQSDIALQMNPFNDSVISEINRQANGQNSILKQTLDQSGQFGSNRSILGANDVDLSRTNQIGGFLQSQFNQSLQNALTTLPGARAQDAAGLLGIGEFQRGLDMNTKQAPITALQTIANLIQGTGATVNNQTESRSTSEGGGLLSTLGGAGKAASGLSSAVGVLKGLSLFSDRRLKENIKPLGQENGHNIYSYNYKGSDKTYIGVMADEVKQTNPDAVENINGYDAVNYDMIGVEFREAVNG